MGRISQIPAIEEKIGAKIDKFILDKAREGKQPTEIASLLNISLSTYYNIVKTRDLKDKLKEIYGAKSRPQGQLAEVAEQFITSRRVAGMRPKTIKNYEEFFSRFFRFMDEKGIRPDLNSFNFDTIQKYFNYLKSEESRFGGKIIKPVKQGTIITAFNIFNALGNWGEKVAKIFPENPMKRMLSPRKERGKLPEDMPDNEIALLLKSFGGNFEDIRNKTIVKLFLDTGMRLEGMSSLKVDSFDLNTGWAIITEKGDKQREICLSPVGLKQLHIYLEARENIDTRLKSLWITENGKEFTYRGISSFLEKLNDAGIVKTHLHAHLFRHVWTKQMFLSGVSAMGLMKMGGWESLDLVKHYGDAYSSKDAWNERQKASSFFELLDEKGGTENG